MICARDSYLSVQPEKKGGVIQFRVSLSIENKRREGEVGRPRVKRGMAIERPLENSSRKKNQPSLMGKKMGGAHWESTELNAASSLEGREKNEATEISQSFEKKTEGTRPWKFHS